MLRYEHGGDVYGNPGVRLDFSVNTNPLGMPEGAKRALEEGVEGFARYPDPRCRALASALAARHGVEEGMLAFGSGAADLIFRLCAMLRPKKALVLAPTFSEYGRAVALFGGLAVEHRLAEAEGFAPGEDLPGRITDDVDMLFLCNPNNPTGRLADAALIRRAADRCAQRGVLLVLDECFIDFTRGESMLPWLNDYPNLVLLRAFTKIYALAGLRLGYALCADEGFMERLRAFGQTWGVSGPAQAAGLAALADAGFLARTRLLVEAERAFLAESLRALGLTAYPSDSNFLLIKSETPLYEKLLARGILVRNCANFAGLDERFIRVGVRTRRENEELIRAIGEVLYG